MSFGWALLLSSALCQQLAVIARAGAACTAMTTTSIQCLCWEVRGRLTPVRHRPIAAQYLSVLVRYCAVGNCSELSPWATTTSIQKFDRHLRVARRLRGAPNDCAARPPYCQNLHQKSSSRAPGELL